MTNDIIVLYRMKPKLNLIVFLSFALLAGACHPLLSTPAATATILSKTPASTITPIPTVTSTPRSYPIPLPTGVLTAIQRSRLSKAALHYVADTQDAAIQVSRAIGYLANEGHPASVCGPLAIAILQDAGFLDPAVDRHSFWKLDPRPDADLNILQQTFPTDRYLWYSFRTPTDQFNFSNFPLYPGDFLYLYAGGMGSFEHMLVVSRVDDTGRVYAVTNLNTPNGYLIQEKMLYDPNEPGTGLFYDWTNQANWRLGLTGFGGFDLWRLKSTPQDPTQSETTLASQLESIFTAAGGEWNMVFEEYAGPEYYERLAHAPLHPASTIKVPLAMIYLKTLESIGATDLQIYLDTHSLNKVVLNELLSSMLVTSDEDATSTLQEWTFAHINYQNVLSQWGITHTWLSPRRSTAADMASILNGLYSGNMASPQARTIILTLLSTYSPNDATRLGGELTRLMNGNGKIYNKRGTITSEELVVGEAAIIEYHSHVYFLTLYAHPRFDGDTTYEQLDAAFPKVADSVWQFMQMNP
jgi:hypothetical protein